MVPIPQFKVNQLVNQLVGNRYHVLRSDKLIVYALLGAFIVLTFGFAVLLVKANDLPSLVPLYYSLPWGEERLVHAPMLAILPGSALLLLAFNLLWMAFFYEKEPLLSKLLAVTSGLIAFLSTYTLIRIIFLIA